MSVDGGAKGKDSHGQVPQPRQRRLCTNGSNELAGRPMIRRSRLLPNFLVCKTVVVR